MFDLKWVRDNPEAFDQGLARRGQPSAAAAILDIDQRRRALLTELQTLQQRRNEASRAIGKLQGKGAEAEALKAEVAAVKTRLHEGGEEERALGAALDAALAVHPNLPAADVPDGADESANVELRRWGAPADIAAPKEHDEIGAALGLMDFETAAAMSGARFAVLSGGLARLERALAQFMLDLHIGGHGYEEVSPPLLVRDGAVYGTGQLPKFAEDLFQTGTGHWLIPTAEVPLANLVAGRILAHDELPRRFVAHTPCFRAEAGAAGRDTRGMIRQHQFYKVELVAVTAPEESEAEHERLTAAAEQVLQRLGLHYRVMLLCAGDMGAAANKTYDLEVWLPGQSRFREISSCSNCGDYQARRMNARVRRPDDRAPRYVHTLNGSGVAVGRALIALLETYQQPDGSVSVPEVLRPYMGGLARIEARA